MELIKEWVTNIILFVLFATVLDMILPNSKFQKYTKMVVGLLLISIILIPVLKLFSYDLEEALSSIPAIGEGKENENEIKNLMDLQKNEIQASQDAYIFKQMTVQLKEKAEKELIDRYGLVITDLKFLMDENDGRPFPENLQKVVIQVREQTEETKAVEAVKPVEINANDPLLTEKEISQKEKVVSLLSKQWSMDKNAIEVHIDGGD